MIAGVHMHLPLQRQVGNQKEMGVCCNSSFDAMRLRRAASALEVHHGSYRCVGYNAKHSCALVSRMRVRIAQTDTLTMCDPQSKSPCTELQRA
jgi:hypothetical protein